MYSIVRECWWWSGGGNERGYRHHAQWHKRVLPSDSSVGVTHMEKKRDENVCTKRSLSANRGIGGGEGGVN